MASIFKNIITFGAAERVEDAQSDYRKVCKRYNARVEECKAEYNRYEKSLNNYAALRDKCIKEAYKICMLIPTEKKEREKFLEQLGMLSEDIPVFEHKLDMFEITKSFVEFMAMASSSIELMDKGKNTKDILNYFGKGFSSVESKNLKNAYTLMKATTAFSTNTKLVSSVLYSGAIASTATIAGGAVASSLIGGASIAGVAGGVAGLGALGAAALNPLTLGIAAVALPLVSHLQANKDIEKIEREMNKIEANLSNVNKELNKFKKYANKIDELIESLGTAFNVFTHEFDKTITLLYPNGIKSDTKVKSWKKYNSTEKEQVLLAVDATKTMLEFCDSEIISKLTRNKKNGK